MPEPKVKTQKAAGKKNGDSSRVGVDRVWQIVDSCHQETTTLPSSEKCRFCGQGCSTWKKLTVHLARHMETISLPVLDLIRDDAVIPVTKGQRRHMPLPTRPPPSLQQQQLQQQQPRQQPSISAPMDIDPYSVAPTRGPEYEVDPTFSRQPIPTYNLTPPQQHQRSRSAGYEPVRYIQTQTSTVAEPVAYTTVTSTDYHYGGSPQTYHHKSPQSQSQQQVYNPQSGFDGGGGGYQYYPPQQSYAGFIPTSAPPSQGVSPMMQNQPLHMAPYSNIYHQTEPEVDSYGFTSIS